MIVQKSKMPPLIIANTIVPREMRWLWYPYIPYNAATLLFGPGGYGKSHITVDIAARLTTGTPLPGQLEGGKPQKVLMLSAEDDFDVVLVPRLMKAGANLDKIAFPKEPFSLNGDGLRGLEAYIHQFGATIVFIDPIVRYMGGKVDMNKANEVREFMGALHEMAMAKQTSIIIVGHSRKSRMDDTNDDPERAMGSADFNNAVRSTLFVTKLSDGVRAMKHVKSNYAPLGKPIAFEFGEAGFRWTGVVDDEDGSVVPVREQKHGTQVKWLKGVLASGPITAKSVEAEAKKFGISTRTLNRLKPGLAESFMRVVDGKPVWYWKLINDEGVDPNEQDISIQGLEDGSRGRELPGKASIGRSSRRKVDAGETAGVGGFVQPVGRKRNRVQAKSVYGAGAGSDAESAPTPQTQQLSNRDRAHAILQAMNNG